MAQQTSTPPTCGRLHSVANLARCATGHHRAATGFKTAVVDRPLLLFGGGQTLTSPPIPEGTGTLIHSIRQWPGGPSDLVTVHDGGPVTLSGTYEHLGSALFDRALTDEEIAEASDLLSGRRGPHPQYALKTELDALGMPGSGSRSPPGPRSQPPATGPAAACMSWTGWGCAWPCGTGPGGWSMRSPTPGSLTDAHRCNGWTSRVHEPEVRSTRRQRRLLVRDSGCGVVRTAPATVLVTGAALAGLAATMPPRLARSGRPDRHSRCAATSPRRESSRYHAILQSAARIYVAVDVLDHHRPLAHHPARLGRNQP